MTGRDACHPDSQLWRYPVWDAAFGEHVDELLRLQIQHFFDHYKDLEGGKWVEIKGWEDAGSARREILESVERYNALPEKPTKW